MFLSEIIKSVANGNKPVKKSVVITVTRDEEGGAIENAKGILSIQRFEDDVPTDRAATITCSTFRGAQQTAGEIKQAWYRLAHVHDIQIFIEGKLE